MDQRTVVMLSLSSCDSEVEAIMSLQPLIARVEGIVDSFCGMFFVDELTPFTMIHPMVR